MATQIPKNNPPAPGVVPHQDDGVSVVLERRTQKVGPPKMYQVVMLNDDYTPMEFVVVTIQEFFGKDLETATQIMLKIHLDGRGVCGVYTRDIAATKVDQVLEAAYKAGHPLKCISEPVNC
jgi:ATP-dependent Clp protease adaptor protein ClpS